MKTIGLIGGLTWESTREYYQIINEAVRLKLGDDSSASILLYSYNFNQIITWQTRKQYAELQASLIDTAEKLEKAGADFLVICANTPHRYFDAVQSSIQIPILHIVDVTAREIIKIGLHKVGLLGTPVTMEEDFYKARMAAKFGIQTVVPTARDRRELGNIIFNELARGIFRETSRQRLKEICRTLESEGIEGIILGCTELPLLLKLADTELPQFNSTLIHATAAAELALR